MIFARYKSIASRSLLIALMTAAMPVLAQPVFARDVTVDVTQIVEHPALDAIREGVRQQLAKNGFVEGKNLTFNFQSAQGNISTATQIAQKFVGDNPDAIVAIGTPSAQAVITLTSDIPVIYSAVTDPVAAKLVPGWAPSGTNVTGVSDAVPINEQLKLIGKVTPGVKKIGIIYNPGEANSVAFVSSLKREIVAGGKKYQLVEALAPRTVDVSTAAKSLVGKVDLIFAPQDNTVASALAGIVKVADEAKLPMFGSDSHFVEQGAAFGLSADYNVLGRRTGKVVVHIINGEAPGAIASATGTPAVYINPAAAERQGVTVPAGIAGSARMVGK